MSGTRPSTWAIVLTTGGEEITAACIDSLLAQDYPALTVLLVDNASPDGSGERLSRRYPAMRYLNTGANLGYAGGNNRGIELALTQGAEFVVILNNDTVADPRCVSLLVDAALSLPRVGAVSPKILFFSDPGRIWYGGGAASRIKVIGRHLLEGERDIDGVEPPRAMTFASGCCMLVPALVLQRVGSFAEAFFMYCEDLELSLRLSAAGYLLYYQPAARLLHRQLPTQSDPSPFQIRLRDRNRRRIARTHHRALERAGFALWFYPTRALRFATYVVRGDWPRARAIVAGAIEP